VLERRWNAVPSGDPFSHSSGFGSKQRSWTTQLAGAHGFDVRGDDGIRDYIFSFGSARKKVKDHSMAIKFAMAPTYNADRISNGNPHPDLRSDHC